MERAYTLSEIDEMRGLLYERVMRLNHVFYDHDAALIEDQLRTYLVAGLGPDDLRTEMAA